MTTDLRRPKFRRVKDMIGWFLGYAACRTCGRTMWRYDEREWVPVPTDREGIFKMVCREHLGLR